jgi:hypothetical protein
MDGLGAAVGRGLGNISAALGDIGGSMVRFLADAFGSVDAGLHQFFPWFIPTWLVGLVVVLIGALFVLRR